MSYGAIRWDNLTLGDQWDFSSYLLSKESVRQLSDKKLKRISLDGVYRISKYGTDLRDEERD